MQYSIITSNCGDCPVTTTTSSFTCTNISVPTEFDIIICTLIVQPVLCDNELGMASQPLSTFIEGKY